MVSSKAKVVGGMHAYHQPLLSLSPTKNVNYTGDGLAFGRWDDIAGKLRTFGRWKRAEWKGNAATGSVGHMARKLTFGRWEEIVGNCLTFGRWDEYGRRSAACGGWMGSGVGRWDEYG